MLYKSNTDFRTVALDRTEDTGRDTACLYGGMNGVADNFPRSWVRGMALDHNGTSGSQSRGHISAGRGKCQRKVGGAKDRDRTDGPLDKIKFGPWQWRTGRKCRIVPGLKMPSIADIVREHSDLASGAMPLALEPGRIKTSLTAGYLGESRTAFFNFSSNCIEEMCPLLNRDVIE